MCKGEEIMELFFAILIFLSLWLIGWDMIITLLVMFSLIYWIVVIKNKIKAFFKK